LKPELQASLRGWPRKKGRDSESLVVEAVERMFIQEVERGLAAAERGEFVDHEDVRKQIESRCRG